ncbi:hypothetical protein DFJ74DRAFT_659454 [Hyaloraphidium curvatum]|nr:hypothetical protein DFJ74DRAFT_659454 [Hyaloraphidium curvatum]
MKDFKAQTIDTPGVIERVSTLFNGHPNLIFGFNTFLPPGYRIVPGHSPDQPVQVITPMMMGTNGAIEAASPPTGAGTAPGPGPGSGPPMPGPPPPPYGYGGGSGYMEQRPGMGAPPQPGGRGGPHVNVPPAMPPQRTPVEFNHAINYVNKIKNRFQNEPETYKQFLEILQTYQKEQKPIQEVYNQVQILFKGAPDLLEEFKQFLPDNNAPNAGGGLFGPPPSMGSGPPRATNAVLGTMPNGMAVPMPRSGPLPPVGNFGPGGMDQPGRGPRGGPVVPGPGSMASKRVPKRPSGGMVHAGPVGVPQSMSTMPAKKKSRTMNGSSVPMQGMPPSSTTSKASQPAPTAPYGASAEELEFFDKVKRFMPKPVYQEFLKLLNLFSQEVIDTKVLVERAEPFLARSPELYEWLKNLVKYEDMDVIFNAPSERPVVDMSKCRRSGQHYRMMPPDFEVPKCSGRDALCNEVLNNTWVSHPIFVSEEQAFQSHKKNQYEEALHKVEDERYEFDLNLEANMHTIALLEPIAKRIQEMSADEKARFTLEPGLGHKGKTIYQRVIKKIYDKDRGIEVIEALHRHPAVAVPIVLKRLKQKDEEWKRAQREWNKVWREVEVKNYNKSLDHQGVMFKANDKKMLSGKSLITEIESIYREQKLKRRLREANAAITANHPQAIAGSSHVPNLHVAEDTTWNDKTQLRLYLKDRSVFRDVRHVVQWSAANKVMSEADSRKVDDFLRTFVRRFFCVEDFDVDEDEPRRPAGTSTRSGREYGDKPSPLNGAVPAAADGDVTMDDAGKPEGSGSSPAQVVPKTVWRKKARTTYQFFGNNHFYVFFRLYGTIYSRLAKMKEKSRELANEGPPVQGTNNIAASLGLLDKNGQEAAPENHGVDRFEKMMEMVHQLFGQLSDDQTKSQKALADFEDATRDLFGTSAYLTFTLDKLAQMVAKQVHTILQDPKTPELLALFKADRDRDTYSPRQEAKYRMNVEDMIRDENVYRIEFIAHENALTFQLLGKDDYSDDTTISQEEKWSLYVDRFVQLNATEGYTTRRREPFLKRHLPAEVPNDPPNNIVTHSGLELKICVNTYRITWVQNTEDYFHHKHEKNSGESMRAMRRARNARFHSWQAREEQAQHFPPELTEDARDLFLGRGKYVADGAATEEQTVESGTLGTKIKTFVTKRR